MLYFLMQHALGEREKQPRLPDRLRTDGFGLDISAVLGKFVLDFG